VKHFSNILAKDTRIHPYVSNFSHYSTKLFGTIHRDSYQSLVKKNKNILSMPLKVFLSRIRLGSSNISQTAYISEEKTDKDKLGEMKHLHI